MVAGVISFHVGDHQSCSALLARCYDPFRLFNRGCHWLFDKNRYPTFQELYCHLSLNAACAGDCHSVQLLVLRHIEVARVGARNRVPLGNLLPYVPSYLRQRHKPAIRYADEVGDMHPLRHESAAHITQSNLTHCVSPPLVVSLKARSAIRRSLLGKHSVDIIATGKGQREINPPVASSAASNSRLQ